MHVECTSSLVGVTKHLTTYVLARKNIQNKQESMCILENDMTVHSNGVYTESKRLYH